MEPFSIRVGGTYLDNRDQLVTIQSKVNPHLGGQPPVDELNAYYIGSNLRRFNLSGVALPSETSAVEDTYILRPLPKQVEKFIIGGYPTASFWWNESCGIADYKPSSLCDEAPLVVVWKNIRFDTARAAYLWEMFQSREHPKDSANLRMRIRLATSPKMRSDLEIEGQPYIRPDWDVVGEEIHKDILRAKLDQHPYLKTELSKAWSSWNFKKISLELADLWQEIRSERGDLAHEEFSNLAFGAPAPEGGVYLGDKL